MNHNLKIDAVYLEQKLSGDKLFEVRTNDRGYQKGDTVTYTEYPHGKEAVNHVFEITYVSNYMQKDNCVVFGEKKFNKPLTGF